MCEKSWLQLSFIGISTNIYITREYSKCGMEGVMQVEFNGVSRYADYVVYLKKSGG